jgi:glycosyltransferase involved in cell wall biosynthesis
VTIGVLARNEAARIGDLLDDVARQTLLSAPDIDIAIVVVANGCSDRTAEVARVRFGDGRFAGVSTAVHELEKPGKSNAWNELVHSIASEGTDFLFFLDGDIRIPSENSMLLVVRALIDSSQAVVAVDRSVKDLELEHPKRFSEWLIKKGTGTANDTRQAIAGAFYCVRYSAVAGIWLPIGLPGEDGFLRAMLLTSSFSHDEDMSLHVFVQNACHVFESLRDARSVIRHNVRLAIGTAINIALFGELRRVRAAGEDVAEYIRRRNQVDPAWVNELIARRLKTTYFPLQPRFLLRRLQQPRSWSSVRAFAVAVFGTAFDAVVFFEATRMMRRGTGAGHW